MRQFLDNRKVDDLEREVLQNLPIWLHMTWKFVYIEVRINNFTFIMKIVLVVY